jgi:hypothetical protein
MDHIVHTKGHHLRTPDNDALARNRSQRIAGRSLTLAYGRPQRGQTSPEE